MIHLLADRNLYQLERYLPPAVDLEYYDPAQGLPSNAPQADALLVRTVTKVNAKTLPLQDSRLRFVGTGSAGTDHVDIDYLENHGVHFASAAGCNARAVAEYVTTVLLMWAENNKVPVEELSIGIIGVGHVGTTLQDLLDKIGVKTVGYDPPRAEREEDYHSASLEEVLNCDVLTFHTPLTYNGNWPTYHWLDNTKLNSREYKLMINASRGGVIDEQALLEAHRDHRIDDFVLDVWENEPDFRDSSARQSWIATPHIAGYSEQAKHRATWMVCRSMAENLELKLPKAPHYQPQYVDPGNSQEPKSLADMLSRVHPIMKYDHALRGLIGLKSAPKSKKFAQLRVEKPFRFEYQWIQMPTRCITQYPVLNKLDITSED